MAKKAAKAKKTGAKKAPSAAQLAARKAFAERAKAGNLSGGKSKKAAAKGKKSAPKAAAEAKIPTLKVKPITRPAYAAEIDISRGKRTPVIQESPKAKSANRWDGVKSVIYM